MFIRQQSTLKILVAFHPKHKLLLFFVSQQKQQMTWCPDDWPRFWPSMSHPFVDSWDSSKILPDRNEMAWAIFRPFFNVVLLQSYCCIPYRSKVLIKQSTLVFMPSRKAVIILYTCCSLRSPLPVSTSTMVDRYGAACTQIYMQCMRMEKKAHFLKIVLEKLGRKIKVKIN